MRSLLLLALLLVGAYCFAINRVDRDLEADGLVRVRRSPKDDSSSSEESEQLEVKSTTAPELTKVAVGDDTSDKDEKETTAKTGNEIEGSGIALDLDEKRETRESGIQSSGLEASEAESRALRAAESSGEEEENVRVLRDTDLGSGSDARLADLPLESSNGQFDESLFDFNENRNARESSGTEDESVRAARGIEASGMESNDEDATVEGSGDVATVTRVSRDVEGSGEALESTRIRVIREGSGDMLEE